MSELPARLRGRGADGLYFLFWLALFLFLAARHTPWRDEYQSWLVSTRTHGVAEFLEAIRYERHPPLHYLILRFAHEGWMLFASSASAWLPRIIGWLFTIATAALLVFGFKAPRWLRWGAPLSVALLFEHGVITRCYPIGNLCLLGWAWLRQRGRPEAAWAVLALGAAVHFTYTLVALPLLAVDLWERRQSLNRRLLWAAGASAVFVLWMVYLQRPPLDTLFPSAVGTMAISAERVLGIPAHALTGFDALGGPFTWNQNPFSGWWGLLPLLVLGASLFTGFPLRRYLLAAAPLLIFFVTSYNPATRHVAVLFVLAIAVLVGFTADERTGHAWGFAPLLAAMVFGSLRWMVLWAPWHREPNFDFSGSVELARAIGPALQRPDSVLVAWPDHIFFAPMGLLDIEIFNPTKDRLQPYPDFRAEPGGKSIETLCASPEELDRRFLGKQVYFATSKGGRPPPSCGAMEQVFESQRPILGQGDEQFSVFRRISR